MIQTKVRDTPKPMWVRALAFGLCLMLMVWLCAVPPDVFGQETKTQSNELEEATGLNKQVVKLFGEGRYDDAILLAVRALAKAPVTCVQCHNGQASNFRRASLTVRPNATPCPTPALTSVSPVRPATQNSPAPSVRQLTPVVTFRSNEDTFRRLAEALASEGRLDEAASAIGLMKKEEYSNFRSSPTNEVDRNADLPETKKKSATLEAERQMLRAKKPRTPKEQERLDKLEEELRSLAKAFPSPTPRENLINVPPEKAEIVRDVSEMRDRLVGFGVERRGLRAKQERTAEEQERLDELDEYIRLAGKAHSTLVNQMFNEFRDSPGLIDRIFGLIDAKALMQDLKEMGSEAVALYTIVGKDSYRVILITPEVMVPGESRITADELETKVQAFRNALQDPNTNPSPLAQELYNLLVGPVAKDLKAARADTLMWSLDGPLRYLPFAALHDKEKYLVETYRNTVFTTASLARLKDTPRQTWRGRGLGVPKAKDIFPALPGVPAELRGIIRMANENLLGGVIDGKRMLDEEFTLKTMNRELQDEFTVLHIASHFYLQRGTDADSFLLLGDATRLTLSQLAAYQNPFGGWT